MESTIKQISELIPEGASIFCDIGLNMITTAREFLVKEGQRLFISGGLAAMGCSLTEAVGASIALGNKPVYSINGDGGIQMNIQEFQTIVSENLPIVIFVLNNSALGLIELFQKNNLKSEYVQTNINSGFTDPSFVNVARAYGIDAYKVEDLSEYADLIRNPKGAVLFDISIAGSN